MSFLRPENWQRIMRRLPALLLPCVGGLLIYQLSAIGWGEIVQSIPTSPWFYLLFLVGYAVLPTSEVLLYGRVWKFSFREGLRIFFLKRVYNQDVVDYSGDVSLLMWARGRFGWSDGDLARVIKDHSIISALTGHVIALAFPLLCFLGSDPAVLEAWSEFRPWAILCGVAIAPLVIVGALFIRRAVFFLPDRELAVALGIHLGRIVTANAVILLQWWIAVPNQTWHGRFAMLTMQCLVGRLPTFLGRDFLVVSAGVATSQAMGLQAGAAAGVLLVNGVLDKAVNAVIFFAGALWRRPQGRPAVDTPQTPTSPQRSAA